MFTRRLSTLGLVLSPDASRQPKELDRYVYDLAERLAAGARNAIRWTKTAVNIGLKQLAHSVMDASISYEM